MDATISRIRPTATTRFRRFGSGRHVWVGFLTLWLFGSPARADTLQWLLIDFPPYSMPKPGGPESGAVDELLKRIVAAWPEKVTHEFVVANTARIWHSLVAGEQVCYTGALHTPERAKQAYLSDVFILPPIQLIVRRDSLDRVPMDAGHLVKLSDLIAQRNLQGVLVSGRSYGAALDAVVSGSSPDSSLSFSPGAQLGANIFEMIARGRADYTLDYDFVLAQHQRNSSSLGQLVALPINGAQAPLIGSFACPRTPWGRAKIKIIDRIVGQLVLDPHYRDQFERWLTPATKVYYAPAFDNFYKDRPKVSLDD